MCRRDRKAGQIDRSRAPLPWYVVKAIKRAVCEAEEILGEPATIPEITLILEKNNPSIGPSPFNPVKIRAYFIAGLMSELLREDMLYTDKMCQKWSVKKHDGFSNFTDIFVKHFG